MLHIHVRVGAAAATTQEMAAGIEYLLLAITYKRVDSIPGFESRCSAIKHRSKTNREA